MFRVLSAVFVVSLCVCALEVSASRLVYPQLRALQEKELSSKEHYKNEQHDIQFDHEAFLGQETAQEWEQLPADEVKEKLRQVALYFPAFENLFFIFVLENIQCVRGKRENRKFIINKCIFFKNC